MLTRRQFWINFSAASIGNIFEHYDKALFAFLAPFLAPLFFQGSQLTALMLTYAIMPIGLFSRPLGSLIFGWIGDHKGRKASLYITLMGMAFVTTLMGCIPTYATVGWVAPVLLAVGRLAQNFFASGETTGGALLILESCAENRRGFYNGLYECSTILGILLASLGVTVLSLQGNIEAYWRVLYFLGGITGGIGLLIRFFSHEIEFQKRLSTPTFSLLWKYRFQFLLIAITAGFSYANYYMITSLLNGYLPLINSITKEKAMEINTFILTFDFLLLPFAGFLTTRFSSIKLLLFFGTLITVASIPLYSLFAHSSLTTIIFLRLTFVLLGVGFSVPLSPFFQDLVPKDCRYTLIAFGTAIGSQLLGTSACSISFWLYKKTNWAPSPALYLLGLGIIATLSICLAQTLRTVPIKSKQPSSK